MVISRVKRRPGRKFPHVVPVVMGHTYGVERFYERGHGFARLAERIDEGPTVEGDGPFDALLRIVLIWQNLRIVLITRGHRAT
jgi:hypothetical protein